MGSSGVTELLPKISEVLPLLHLHGLPSGDFVPAWTAPGTDRARRGSARVGHPSKCAVAPADALDQAPRARIGSVCAY
ncbi:hypothetical protein [Streptomyces sp. NPDC090114]|uniref:hypothetical protein n=1 Tax=Streptomyces sp. NPDC090114 TaxID=3365950 RepID=UPI0038158E09